MCIRDREDFDHWWNQKYGPNADGDLVRIADAEDIAQDGQGHPHLPAPSFWPLVLAAGLPFVGYGLIFSLWWCVPGAMMIMAAMFGWALEPPDDFDLPHEPAGHGGDGDHAEVTAGDGAAGELGAGDADSDSDEAATAETREEAPVG